jgi:hypothetical protein
MKDPTPDPLTTVWTQEALDKVYRELQPGDHFMALGEHVWHTVPDRPTKDNDMKNNNTTPNNGHDAPLTKLRDAAAANDQRTTFEKQYESDRLAAMAATRADLDKNPVPAGPRLTTAELADYRAPDPYADGLKKLREQR